MLKDNTISVVVEVRKTIELKGYTSIICLIYSIFTHYAIHTVRYLQKHVVSESCRNLYIIFADPNQKPRILVFSTVDRDYFYYE